MKTGRPRKAIPFAAMHEMHHGAKLRPTSRKYQIGAESLRRALAWHCVELPTKTPKKAFCDDSRRIPGPTIADQPELHAAYWGSTAAVQPV